MIIIKHQSWCAWMKSEGLHVRVDQCPLVAINLIGIAAASLSKGISSIRHSKQQMSIIAMMTRDERQQHASQAPLCRLSTSEKEYIDYSVAESEHLAKAHAGRPQVELFFSSWL